VSKKLLEDIDSHQDTYNCVESGGSDTSW